MAYKPPKQTIDDNDLKGSPSNEAVFEALKLKLDEPSVSGTNGQLLQLDGYVSGEPVTSWVNPPAAGFTNPMTTAGDMIYGGASGAATRLAAGTSQYALISNGSTVEWRILGTGSTGAAYPNNSLILGKAKPASFTSTESILLGTGTTGNVATGASNILVGHNIAPLLSTGLRNVIMGSGTTGAALTTAERSVIIGYNTAAALASGTGVFIGPSVVGSDRSVGIGPSASTSSRSVAVGDSASSSVNGTSIGPNATGGNNSVSIGYFTSAAGVEALAVGPQSSASVAWGVAVGYGASVASNSGVAVGRQAATGSGNDIVVVGGNAGLSTATGSNNVIIGRFAGSALSSGGSNVFVGKDAGKAVTTGATNIFLGFTAGDAVTTGSSNTIIGDIAGTATLANTIILAAGTTERIRHDATKCSIQTGNLAIETLGKGLQIKTGTNATAGKETGLSAVTSITVNTTAVTASSLIFVQPMNTSDKHGFAVSSITAGTSFTVDFSGTFTGDMAWFIVEPA